MILTDLAALRANDSEMSAAIDALDHIATVTIAEPTPANVARLAAAIQPCMLKLIDRVTVISGGDQLAVQRLISIVERLELGAMHTAQILDHHTTQIEDINQRLAAQAQSEPYQ